MDFHAWSWSQKGNGLGERQLPTLAGWTDSYCSARWSMRMARSDPRYVHGVLARGAIATRIQVRAASDEQAEQLAGALSVATGEALTAGT